MAYRRNSDWSLNKGTDDIVYSFLDGTTKRFRKIDGRVYEVTESAITCKTTTMTPTDEISAKQFDELKRWSDENYQAEDRYEVHHSRGQVPLELVENTMEASAGFLLEEEKDEDFRTLENALLILDALKLTDAQRRRFEMAVRGMTTREIAAAEECSQPCIVESLAAVEKKIKNYFLKSPQKHPIKTSKK